MYYPFLRGKRFELLALRELAADIKDKNIIPIIEPIVIPEYEKGDFWRCLKEVVGDNNLKVIVVINPNVGELKNSIKEEVLFEFFKIFDSLDKNGELISIGIHLNFEKDVNIISSIVEKNSIKRSVYFIHSGMLSNAAESVNKITQNAIDVFHLAEEKSNIRAYSSEYNFNSKKIIKLTDPFCSGLKKNTNSEYENNKNNFFTNNNIYYEDDGYSGYSDYLTIGKEYVESGGIPMVVAIHLTFRKNDGSIWIRHFASKTMTNTRANIAGKFGEALNYLLDFTKQENLTNKAICDFQWCQDNARFPGLGGIKKISIKNHIYVNIQ